MPSEMEWYIPGRMVYVREDGDLQLHEVQAANETARIFLEESPEPLYFLIDRTNLESAPKSLSGLIGVLDTLRHQNFGCAVIFGQSNNRYFRALTKFLARYFGINVQEVDTFEQALHFLIELDSELGPLIQQKERHRLSKMSHGGD